jgi:serine protease Do
MNDEQQPSDATGAGRPDSLDEVQPAEVSRFAPTPDPRPDARWAWAAPGSQPAGDRWYEPAPSESGGVQGYATGGWGLPPATGWGEPQADGGTTPPVPTGPVSAGPPRRRGSVGLGRILAASVLSAALASGGTVVALDRAGAFDRTTPTTTAATGAQGGNPAPVSIDESSAVINAAAKLGPAVVKITVQGQSTDPFGTTPTQGVGSGIIYDSNGWIVTNKHVVTGETKLTVELKDGRQFDGRVYGVDTLTDLAIVKVDQTGLPAAAIGRSDGLKVGQLVVAIGSPLGTYSFSVTSGIVSAQGREIQTSEGGRITNLIQTDAAINPGNSGGPLADASGNVVGINTAIATASNGIGFAIPIDIARPIMNQALKGEALSRPWIGVRFESIDLQVQKDNKLPVGAGAWVTTSASGGAVVANSPAATAGIKDGDIILAVNGIKIDGAHPLDALLVQFAPGETVKMDLLRNGAAVSVSVTLGTRPANL